MITKQSDINLKQSQDFKSYTFGIKDTGLAHIFNVLRNQLYSDKILAVIREYSANAIDAHAELGKQSTPIKVTLPNKLNLKLKIRDFGRGLTENQIGEIYAMYGESTKRGTNQQVGQLGLGCKSAFAYGDNFVINSFVGGNVTSYNAFIDPSQVGRISKLHSKKTKEKNGIEIEIPVNQDDVDAFREKAIDLFQNFEVKPDIEGQSIQDAISDGDVLIGSDDGSWKVIRNSSSVAVMGNIPYPIDGYAMDFDYREEAHLRTLVNLGVRLRVDIGDLEVAASREALQYTKATKESIRKKLQEIVDALPTLLGQRFSECKSMWEAKCLYQASFGYGGFAYHLSDIMDKKGVTWVDSQGKSHKITDASFKFAENTTGGSGCLISVYAKNRHGKRRVKSDKDSRVHASGEKILFVEDDRDTHVGRMNRIAPLLENYEGRADDEDMKDKPIYDKIYLIHYDSPAIKRNVLEKNKFDAPTEKLSSLHPVKLTVVYPRDTSVKHGNINAGGVSKAKHTSNVFVFDTDFNGGNWHHPKSDFFKIQEVELDNIKNGVYVILDKFYIKNPEGAEQHPNTIKEMTASYKGLTGKDLPTVYAFKVKQEDVPKKQKGWTDLHSWYKAAVNKYLEDNSLTQEFVDSEAASKHLGNSDHCDFHFLLRKMAKCKDATNHRNPIKSEPSLVEEALSKIALDNSPLKKYLKAVESMVPTQAQDKQMRNIREQLGKDFKNWHKGDKVTVSHDLDKLYAKVIRTYKMLHYYEDNFLCGWGYQGRDFKKSWKDLTNYANLVDATYVRTNIFEEANKIEAKKQ